MSDTNELCSGCGTCIWSEVINYPLTHSSEDICQHVPVPENLFDIRDFSVECPYKKVGTGDNADNADNASSRQPSAARGCLGKANLGSDYVDYVNSLTERYGKVYGIYACPHCGGTHATTKLENAGNYAELLYVSKLKEEP